MKKILLFALLISITKISIAQNVGIGNNNPQTTLDITGGLGVRAFSVSPVGNAVNIPDNQSFVVVGVGTSTDTVIAYMPAYVDGQRMLIFNAGAHTIKINVYSDKIPPNEVREFICRLPGGWTYIGANVVAANSWGINGNAGTDTNNFIGTTDNNMMLFKINNIRSGQIGGTQHNLSLGFGSLPKITNPTFSYLYNTAIGDFSMFNTEYGYGNTAVGYSCMQKTNGYNNTAIGTDAMRMASSPQENTGIGYLALYGNSGFNNVALGSRTLIFDTAGNENIAIGVSSMQSSLNSNSCISIGTRALSQNKAGNGIVAIGHEALGNDTAANGTVAIGRAALYSNVYSKDNLAIGDSALWKSGATWPAYSYRNTAIGNKVMMNNTTGYDNVAVGTQALTANSSGDHNTAIGANNLLSNTTGRFNTAIGARNMLTNTTGSENTAIGDEVLRWNISGHRNTGLGFVALLLNETGNNNVGIGDSTLASNFAGSGNVAIGHHAGTFETTSNKLYIENSKANKDSALIYGDFSGDSLNLNAKVNIRDFTRLGTQTSGAPAIKMKKITGTNGAAGVLTPFAHGLTQSKILSVSVLINASTGNDVTARSTYGTFEFDYYISNTNIYVKNISGNDSSIVNRPVRILITYEE
jgi:hypothetical protein